MSTLTVGTIQSNTTLPPVIQNSSNTEIGTFCRAWVNFNGTGAVAIRSAFNVSSIVDNGTGAFVIVFATAMPTANYCAVSSGGTPGVRPNLVSVPGQQAAPGQTTTECKLSVFNTASDLVDPTFASVAFFI